MRAARVSRTTTVCTKRLSRLRLAKVNRSRDLTTVHVRQQASDGPYLLPRAPERAQRAVTVRRRSAGQSHDTTNHLGLLKTDQRGQEARVLG